MKYIMALDQGTTSSRAMIFDRNGRCVSKAQKELTPYFPRSGWVELDAMQIWSSQMSVAQEAMYKIDVAHNDIAAIGITNQRETTIVWDAKTGVPICSAIVWQCRRTAELCDELKSHQAMIREHTGLVIDAYFSATKLKWILDNIPNARDRAANGELLFGTVDTWLLWKLTEGRTHITDYSNASRTMMFNISALEWDKDILELLDIPQNMLPTPVSSSEVYAGTSLFGGSVPIASIAGDQQAALFGQMCFNAGDTKNTYGTGGFLLMNTGNKPIFSKEGLLTTIAWGIDGEVYYALEGSIFVAGAAIQWLRDEMGLIDTAADSERLAQKVADSGGVYVVPAFTGLGAPHWDQYACGTIVGLRRNSNKYHIVRATLESIAFQTADVLNVMCKDTPLSALRVDGGASANDFLVQFQADIIDAPVYRPECIETTARGAAYLAGLAVGYWESTLELQNSLPSAQTFFPKMSPSVRKSLLDGWQKALTRCLGWG